MELAMVQLSDAELLDELQRLADELGRTPSINAMAEHGAYAPNTYSYRFGSWNEAVEAAGLDPRHSPAKIPREELVSELLAGYEALGRWPTGEEMRVYGEYSRGPYMRQFGSWEGAKQAAAEAMEQYSP